MSDASISSSPVSLAGSRDYQLSDGLARLCLPAEFRDSYRRLAWVDSICFLFLVIGLIGLRAPRIVERPLTPPPENVPVVFTPPEEQPKPQQVVQEEQPPEEQQPTVEAPQIPTVVAANAPNVAFAVPFPWPTSYPREAMDQRLQGTVMLYVVVDQNGSPTQVDIKDSSRHYVLDRFAQQWVKTHWRWLPGETRYFYVPFQFNLQGG